MELTFSGMIAFLQSEVILILLIRFSRKILVPLSAILKQGSPLSKLNVPIVLLAPFH